MREEKREEGQLGVCCNRRRGGKKKVAIVLYIPLENPSYDQAKFPFSLSVLPPPPPLYKHQHTWSEFVEEGLASVSAFSEERPNLHCYIDVIAHLFVLIVQSTWNEEKKVIEHFQIHSYVYIGHSILRKNP